MLENGRSQGPVVFKPPLENFKPDALVSLDDAVALVDARYKKHKNALFLTRQDTFAEVLLADNESEYRDWVAKINYAATFRSTGVRMRGTLGAHEVRKSTDAARALSNVSNDSNTKSENQSRPSTLPEELSEELVSSCRLQIWYGSAMPAYFKGGGTERESLEILSGETLLYIFIHRYRCGPYFFSADFMRQNKA